MGRGVFATNPMTDFFVDGIVLQKDEFRSRDDGPSKFPDDDTKEAQVEHFKRFVVRGHARDGDEQAGFKILISLRGHLITFVSDDHARLASMTLAKAVEDLLLRYDYEPRLVPKWREGPHGIGEEVSEEVPPMRIVEGGPKARRVVAAVRDGFWVADVLHHVRDGGGF